MGRIEHYIHFGLLLHIKEGDACFWSPILNQAVTKNIHRN